MTYGFNGKGCPDARVEAHEYDWIYDEKKTFFTGVLPINAQKKSCTNLRCN